MKLLKSQVQLPINNHIKGEFGANEALPLIVWLRILQRKVLWPMEYEDDSIEDLSARLEGISNATYYGSDLIMERDACEHQQRNKNEGFCSECAISINKYVQGVIRSLNDSVMPHCLEYTWATLRQQDDRVCHSEQGIQHNRGGSWACTCVEYA